jgi:hypothetical protein
MERERACLSLHPRLVVGNGSGELPKEMDVSGTSKKYEIHSGGRVVSTQFSVSPLQAVVDYVRSYGVKDDEITRLGVDCVSWAGARFTAVLAPTESPLDAMRVSGMTPEQRDSLRKEIDARVRERMGSRGDARPVRRQA